MKLPLDLVALKPHVASRSAVVMFTRNADIQAAFDVLLATVPRGWAKRGNLEWTLRPRDDDYGDMLANGWLGVRWKA